MENDWIWQDTRRLLKRPKNGNDNNFDKLKDTEILHPTS